MHVRDALTKEANMSIGAKFALTAAIALSMVATAAAAPRQQKNVAYRTSPRTLPSARRAVIEQRHQAGFRYAQSGCCAISFDDRVRAREQCRRDLQASVSVRTA